MEKMSDTLDRLKALNSKLEAKLSAKKSTGIKQPSLLGEAAQEAGVTQKTPPPSRKRGSQKPKELPERAKEPSTSTGEVPAQAAGLSEEVGPLAQRLYRHLGVDTLAEPVRARNLERLAQLFLTLDIRKKVEKIEELFIFKAMNISGVGLKEEDFGEIREGKYVQVIAITYEPDKNGKKKAKNISLGYFGKAETLEPARKNRIIEFVLRWRYEKAFQNLEHYRSLLSRVEPKETLF
jgi:hypothetical protein